MRTNREQTISSERVLRQIQGSFITESGKVISGRWPEGEMAPVIFDNRYKSYLPVFKEAKPGGPKKVSEDTIKRVGRRKRYYVPFRVTFEKVSNRIYFQNPFSPSRQWFIDLSGVADDVEEAYLLKVLDCNAMIGVFVYYVGTDCKVVKFKCMASKTSPEEVVNWEGIAYAKSSYESIVSTFSALMPAQGDTIPLDSHELEGGGEYVDTWAEVARDYSPALKCLSLWMDTPGSSDLFNLQYELGALLLVEWYLKYYLMDYPEGFREATIYIDYLVVYRDGAWLSLGRVYDTVLVYIAHGGYGKIVALLINDDRAEWYHEPPNPYAPTYFKADYISGLKKLWPVMNNDGVGIAGYWALWEYIYATTYWSNYYFNVYPFETHQAYWWTPTNERVEGTPLALSRSVLCGDAPSISGNGIVSRAMSRKTIYPGDSQSQYRIAGVHYENDQTIPEVIFNSAVHPFGRVAIEMELAAAEIGLACVPAEDVEESEGTRIWEPIDPNPIPPIYRVEIEITCGHSFWWKQYIPSMGGTSQYGVVYEDYFGYPTRLPDPIKYGMNPTHQIRVGRPHANRLTCCGFIYGLA